jgi:hypothetical protein
MNRIFGIGAMVVAGAVLAGGANAAFLNNGDFTGVTIDHSTTGEGVWLGAGGWEVVTADSNEHAQITGGAGQITQVFANPGFVGGETVTLTFDMKSVNNLPSDFIRLRLYANMDTTVSGSFKGDENIISTVSSLTPPLSDVWQSYSFDLAIPSSVNIDDDGDGNTPKVDLAIGNIPYFNFWIEGGNGLAVDNVVLVPEPASLALLGLGGLAIAGGRRRKA